MSIPTDIDTSVLLQLLRLPVPPSLLQPFHRTGTDHTASDSMTHHRSSKRPKISRRISPTTLNSSRPSYPPYTMLQPGPRETSSTQWGSRRRLDWTGPSATAVDSGSSSSSRSHNRTRALIRLQQRRRLESGAPPILEDEEYMTTIEAEVEAGARANQSEAPPARVGLRRRDRRRRW